ncbi:hypothetical protein SLA2020_112240 [Shorea laevis]
MKTDHVFRELSGSDEFSSESWSLGNDVAYGESVHGGGQYRDSWRGEEERDFEKDTKRSDEVEQEADKANDVACGSGQRHQEERGDSFTKKETGRGKKFKIVNVEESMMKGDGSKEWSGNECVAVSNGKSQKFLSNLQGERVEDTDLVPDSLSEHLMLSQELTSKEGEDVVNGPAVSSRYNEHAWEKGGGLPSQTCSGEGDPWATNMDPTHIRSGEDGMWAINLGSQEDNNKEQGDVVGIDLHIVKGALEKNQEKMRERSDGAGTENENEDQSFWQGFESESGQEKPWMGRCERNYKKQRRKKSRSCSVVYKNSRRVALSAREAKQKKSKRKQKSEDMMPNFSPNN